jgi:DNA segregation ATPase FtsK/SpoIIIE, S-DNA-T family
LWAVGALALGAFFALAVLPPPVASVTGGIGVTVGGILREWLGVGVAAVPLIPLAWCAVLFGHRERGVGVRLTWLLAGLAFLVPFAVAIGYQLAGSDLRAPHPWPGLIAGLVAYTLRGPLGLAGEIFLAAVALSALTILTVGWNPLARLRADRRSGGQADRKDSAAAVIAGDPAPPPTVTDEEAGPPELPVPVPIKKKREKKPREAAAEPAAGSADRLTASPPDRPSLPPLDILDEAEEEAASFEAALDAMQETLLATLKQFKVDARAGARTTGPVVTQYEIIPEPGVKVGRIAALADDLALTMKAPSIRIVAPIPGRGAVGIEVPNPTRRAVGLRKLLESKEFQAGNLELPIALGEDLEGRPIVTDLARMPHLLIAGATGSGKSVCINTIITSLVYHHTKHTLRMLMIDPKMVELAMYKDLPHLRHNVVTDNKDAAKVFKWAVWEMQDRYELLHANGARNIVDFNRKWEAAQQAADGRTDGPTDGPAAKDAPRPLKDPKGEPYTGGRLPYIVLFVDELADLMMTVQAEIETPLAQLAQKARAIGIHVVLATQRPSVNVITGLIKANFPSRISFRVASKVDSRTVLDQNGAEALLGYGDMLFLPPGKNDPQRVQGAFISTEETERLMEWFEQQHQARLAAMREEERAAQEEANILEAVKARAAAESEGEGGEGDDGEGGERDPLFKEAALVCIQNQGGSTSILQRRLKIGYGRAARICDQLEDAGILGPAQGSKPREVLVGIEYVEGL